MNIILPLINTNYDIIPYVEAHHTKLQQFGVHTCLLTEFTLRRFACLRQTLVQTTLEGLQRPLFRNH